MTAYDVVIVGAGINGMVAAAEIAAAGWRVALVDNHDRIGGFIASDELIEPGFVHDTFSSWHPLFHIGAAFGTLMPELARHGLEYRNTDGVLTGSVSRDSVVVCHRDPATTAEGFSPADGKAYLAALDRMVGDIDAIGALLGIELRSRAVTGPVLKLLRRGGRARLEAWGRDSVMSGRSWSTKHFTGSDVDQLWSPWLLHAGLSPDSASGGLMMPLFAATMHGAGLPVVAGGAGNFLAAFEGLLAERGVDLVLGDMAERIIVRGGRAASVIVGGREVHADKAILASVAPKALWGGLVAASEVPPAVATEAAEYRPGRAAMQVHVTLSKPLEWAASELAGAPLVHISDGSGSTGIACAEASAGLLPRRPTVAVGQQFLLDPQRVPEGRGMLWLQMQEVPYRPVGDAAGELDTSRGWTDELVSGYVERVLDLVEEHAPGTKESVRGIKAFSPADLESHNPNAISGDPYGGSAELDQNLLWRPGPASAKHRTRIKGLWHIGAATHPGPGLGGGSGHIVAQAIGAKKRG